MNDKLLESAEGAMLRTLQSEYCPALIKAAREKQTEILLEKFRQGHYKIADIGCGQGFHGSLYAPFSEVYHGFEISPAIAAIARDTWHRQKLDNTQVFEGDAAQANLPEKYYDWVVCLYFTPGNLRDISDDLSLYTDAYLDKNPVFIRIMSNFYRALKVGGALFLTVYKDVPEAEAAQIDYYKSTNQKVITEKGSRFVATAENFWSVRWTEKSMISNLLEIGVEEKNILFNDLNEIAWLVEVKRTG